ncbi:MAG: DoxX family protein [Chloroflexi bacterium]|nr:DoxX family protein [Chloroflexota bacterium]
MKIFLWVLQVLLAAAFAAHGWLFLSPPAELLVTMNSMLPTWFRLFLGLAEVLAAIGLILPGLTRILPGLIPLAAAGLMIVMASASVLHVTRGEISSAITTAVLFILVTFVAYMRWKVTPVLARAKA